MGLRQLYFLLGDLVEKLVYLKYGIAVILAFIGVKLFFHALHENELPFINGGHHVEWAPEIGTFTSLASSWARWRSRCWPASSSCAWMPGA
jgi:tellurite resistance protein TerC